MRRPARKRTYTPSTGEMIAIIFVIILAFIVVSRISAWLGTPSI